MADKGFFFCFKSFPWGSLAFFQENFSWKNQFVLDLIVHSFWHTCAIVQKNHTFTVSSILLSEYSFLTPYWFPYNLNQELNAFHIWQKNPPQKKKKNILSSFLSFCHNPLLRSHSAPSRDAGEQDDQVTCLELCGQQGDDNQHRCGFPETRSTVCANARQREESMLLLLLSCFSPVRLYATPEMAAHHAPPSLGFSRQEHWSGLPFPSPMHESEKWKWSCSVMSDS